eukprot:CAMPEP_0206459676 /NCGR_PEP_ID=MMETSP0324_2-20121206/24313_1 /ASSEMBLY_ACC=CAM_ASM_000836 /TAXON_ID=2866 /ORGANISM="Crypthecodinium cohnii, Strain Seligo" /LENGTH=522 /DNA_ID=CAMNT_0053931263 /DNA_START=14 /DNA_END=1578 /DNA_ORIENTATION=+
MSSAWEMRKKNIARELAEIKLREASLLKKNAKLETEADHLRSELQAYQDREAANDRLRCELDERCRGLDRERAEMAMMTTTAQSELMDASARERNLLRTTVDQRVLQTKLANEEAQTLARAVDAEAEVRRLQGVEEGMDRNIAELRSELQESNGQTRSCAMTLARLETLYNDLYFDHENQTEALRSAVESAAAFSSRCESLEDELRGAKAGFRLAEVPAPPPPWAGFAEELTRALAEDLARHEEEEGEEDEEEEELRDVMEEAKERKADHLLEEASSAQRDEAKSMEGEEEEPRPGDGRQQQGEGQQQDWPGDDYQDRKPSECDGQEERQRDLPLPQQSSIVDASDPGDAADASSHDISAPLEEGKLEEEDCHPSPPLWSNRPPPPPPRSSGMSRAEYRRRPRDEVQTSLAERRQANDRLIAVADEGSSIYPYHHPDALLPEKHHTVASSAAASSLHDRSNKATSCPPEGRREDTAMHYLQAVPHLERLPAARTKHSGCRQDYPRGGSTHGMRARLLHDVLT